MATLVVVGILFFVLALVAAYTNRSMLFEQRTSVNQYRALQAAEAAEAGVEWALSMLNTGRIDDLCQPTADAAQPTFRDRYLAISSDTGLVTPTGTLDAEGGSDRWPTCVFDGSDWNCRCPPAGVGAPPAPTGAGIFPAFRVRFVEAGGAAPGVVRLDVNGCTRLDDECLDFPARALGGEGRATHEVLLALRSGLAAVPVAPITVRGALDAGAAALGAFNADAESGAFAILAGAAVSGSALRLGRAPGSPADGAVIAGDAMLAAMPDGERLFTSTFALPSASYRLQPGAVLIDCSTACTADRVRAVAARHPGHVIWADGDVDLDAGADIGSVGQPVLLVVTGDVDLDVTLYGLVVGRDGASWSGGGTVRGALIAEGDWAGPAAYDVVYEPEVLRRLHRRSGSFVRVPGGWRDYR